MLNDRGEVAFRAPFTDGSAGPFSLDLLHFRNLPRFSLAFLASDERLGVRAMGLPPSGTARENSCNRRYQRIP
jgi:hypothetical protein